MQAELDDREFEAFAAHYKTTPDQKAKIRKYLALVPRGDEGEHFECRHCGRAFGVVEVFTVRDVSVLLEHPARGMPSTRASQAEGRFFKFQCGIVAE